ncbi:MAG TPA: riboflavin synthase [Myxococcota bacterium]|nr:riboflavin synthase [Myxococcota bacterium]
MFTGLVTDLGEVLELTPHGRGRRLRLSTAYDIDDLELGASIACDGICLTVESKKPGSFTVTAGIETLQCTTLGGWKRGRKVHLEQALRLGDRLGGHLVSGHVDGVGRTTKIERLQESVVTWIEAPRELSRYVATKGSICIDGVSLTVNEVRGATFRVNLVPHTVANTHLGSGLGEPVNLEVDLLARYVERLLEGAEPGLTMERLQELGYGGKS